MPRPAREPVVCAALALALGAGAMLPTLASAGWSPTALPRVAAGTRLARAARAVDPHFRTAAAGGYDGQFYWAIALDPLPTGRLASAIDKPSYRYGHPLYAWAARLVALARPRWVAAALAVVGLASLAAGAAIAAAVGGRRAHGWRDGLFVAVNPGLVVAAAHDLAEPLAAALLLGVVATYTSRRRRALVLCALLPLAKEPLLLVPAGIAARELVRGDRKAAAAFGASLLPALLWWTYLRVHLGAWFTSGTTALASPLSGWASSLGGPNPRHLAPLGAALLALVLVLLLLAAVRALRSRGAVAVAYLALAAVAACLAPNATWAFSTALRNVALVLVLVPFVSLDDGRAGTVAPPAGVPSNA